MFEVARALVVSCDNLAEVWNRSDEILEAQQQTWGQRALVFREWYCSTTGWLHFESENDVLSWVGRVLGVDLNPSFAERELVTRHGRIDFGSPILQERFCAARKRYLDAAVQG